MRVDKIAFKGVDFLIQEPMDFDYTKFEQAWYTTESLNQRWIEAMFSERMKLNYEDTLRVRLTNISIGMKSLDATTRYNTYLAVLEMGDEYFDNATEVITFDQEKIFEDQRLEMDKPGNKMVVMGASVESDRKAILTNYGYKDAVVQAKITESSETALELKPAAKVINKAIQFKVASVEEKEKLEKKEIEKEKKKISEPVQHSVFVPFLESKWGDRDEFEDVESLISQDIPDSEGVSYYTVGNDDQDIEDKFNAMMDLENISIPKTNFPTPDRSVEKMVEDEHENIRTQHSIDFCYKLDGRHYNELIDYIIPSTMVAYRHVLYKFECEDPLQTLSTCLNFVASLHYGKVTFNAKQLNKLLKNVTELMNVIAPHFDDY
jgi:hypothetical protein